MIKKILTSFLLLVKDLFVYSLIIYLSLFLLESFFPGFVNHDFNLNIILWITFIIGLLSFFSPKTQGNTINVQSEKPSFSDFLLLLCFALLGSLFVFLKVENVTLFKLLLSFLVGVIILLTGFASLLKESSEVVLLHKPIGERKFPIISIFSIMKMFFWRKISLPIPLVLSFLIIAVMLFPQKGLNQDLSRIYLISPTPIPLLQKSSVPSSISTTPKPTPSRDILIKVLNGTTTKGTAKNFAEVLKIDGFQKVTYADADNYLYKNAVITFRPEDEAQATLIKGLLDQSYPSIEGRPSASSSAEITVILGKSLSEIWE